MLYFEFGKVTIWYGLLVIFTRIAATKSPSIHLSCIWSHQTRCSSQNSTKQRNFPGMIGIFLGKYLYFDLKGTPFSKDLTIYELPLLREELQKRGLLTVIASFLTHEEGSGAFFCSSRLHILYVEIIAKKNVAKWGFSTGIVQFQQSRNFMGIFTFWCHFQWEGVEANSLLTSFK